MKFNTTDNAFGNQLYGLGSFYIRQWPDYFNVKYVQGDLMHRQMLSQPGAKSGDNDVSYIDNTPLTGGILPDKSKSLKTLVETIHKEIDDRVRMREQIMGGMDGDILKCDNYLLEIRYLDPRYDSVNISRRRSALEHEIFSLEKDKRMEEVNCWRDLVFVKKDLLATLKEYWAAKNREKLLSEDLEEDVQYGS